MTVDLRETRLPGVGVKYSFGTAQGGRMSVILHNDGQRDIYYYRRSGDDEPTAVIELHDDEARQLGAIIGGAYERPRIVEELEMALGELHIEWVPVPDTSPAIGKTLAECGLRAQTGVTVIAILREPEPVSGAQPGDIIQQGDMLVAVGKAGQFSKFRRLLAEGPFEPSEPPRSSE
jgi:K+:H+ antiporter subunit KhtT